MIVYAPVSVGELIDKITILQIKESQFAKDISKLSNVQRELDELNAILAKLEIPDVTNLTAQLKDVNQELWHIEDYKRAMEKDQNFGPGFVNAARQVYLKNDLRARIKKDINILTKSAIIEEKSH